MLDAALPPFLDDARRYIGLDADDVVRVQGLAPTLAPHFATIAEHFYRCALAHPGAHTSLTGGPQQLKRLKGSLVAWMDSGLRGPFDDAFYEQRAHVARRHVEIGLSQPYIVAGIGVIRRDYLDVLERAFANDPAHLHACGRAIDRLLDLELAVLLEAYGPSHRAAIDREVGTHDHTVTAWLLVIDDRGLVVDANPAVAAATGVALTAMVGQPWIERFVPTAEHNHARAAFEQAHVGERGVAFEGQVLCRPGDELEARIVHWRLTGLTTAGGTYIYASGLDMTEVRDLERRTRLAAKLAAVGAVSAGLAHEIRNPLNSSTLALELLERRMTKALAGEIPGPLREPLAMVRSDLSRLSSLVTEFLQFARPGVLHLQDIDLVATVAAVVRRRAPVKQRSLELIAPDAAIVVEADAQRIQRIVHNLIDNALDAAHSTVVITVARSGAGACIRVHDDGPGIDPEIMPQVFEPFFTTKPRGTGLGLAIAHSLVELHGGSITITCDGGTEVVVELRRRV